MRVTADTTPMRRAIDRAAGDAAKSYTSVFGKKVEAYADANLAGARERLARALVDPKVFDQWAKDFDGVGDAAKRYRNELAALKREGQLNIREFDTFSASINRWERSTLAAQKAAEALSTQQQKAEAERQIQIKSLTNFFRVQDAGYKRIVRAQEESVKAAKELARQEELNEQQMQKRSLVNFFRVQEDGYKRLLVAQRKTHTQVTSILADEQTKWGRWRNVAVDGLDRVDRRLGFFSLSIGKAFGKGSRNNFLNFIGSFASGMASLASLIPRGLSVVTRGVDTFFDAFGAARLANVGKLASAGKGLLAVFGGKGGVVGVLAGAAIAVVAFGKFLPGIVSLISMLGGVVTALASSISIGLIGSLAALVPVLAGGVVGLGSLIGVFTAFFRDDKNKKYVENLFKPFKELNKSYYPEVKSFLNNVSQGFDDLIADIRPGIDAFFSSFKEKMNDGSTRAALSQWSDSIGRISTSLSQAGTSFLSGLIGFFVPVLPYAERLAGWIEDIAAGFDSWANSKAGRDSITTFMERASVAGGKVKGILREVGELIVQVFDIAEPTGTGFLDGILDTLTKLNDEIRANPKGLTDWFGDVKGIGSSVGALAKDAGTLIKNLNSAEARDTAQGIADALVSIGDLAADISSAADAVSALIDALSTPLPSAIMAILNGRAKPPPIKVPVEAETSKWDTAYQQVTTSKIDPKSVLVNGNTTEWAATRDGVIAQKFQGKTVEVNGNRRPWEGERATVVAQKFGDKTVKVNGNTVNWSTARQGVANYAFTPKVVRVGAAVDYGSIYATRSNIISALSGISVRVRVAGINAPGGVTMAEGGILHGPTHVLAGEAGREAFVPLDRPLSMIDPSVRDLAAYAQGKKTARMGSGGIVGGGSVTVMPGAIVVQSNQDPAQIAQQVIDKMAEQFR